VCADEVTSLALSPLILLHLLRRQMRGLEHSLGPRVGLPTAGDSHSSTHRRPVWLHGSSVGESLSALALARLLAQRKPGQDFLITSGTLDGVDVVCQRLGYTRDRPSGVSPVGFGADARVTCLQAPADLPFAVWAFRRRWRPAALIVLEADLWPSMLAQCAHSGIPLVLVDGRISERSAGRWGFWLLRPLIAYLLARFNVVLCQSAADEARLRALGANQTRCLGSMKGAAGALPFNSAAVRSIQEALCTNVGATAAPIGGGRVRHQRRVWVAASTHDTEEEFAACAHRHVLTAMAYSDNDIRGSEATGCNVRPLLVVIPRHPRRCAQVVQRLAKQHPMLRIALHSAMPSISSLAAMDVLVVDALGVMGEWYTIADVALVGGSLVDGIGGHNVIEPALLACVPLHGPFNKNGQHLIDALRKVNTACIRQVSSTTELAAAVLAVLEAVDGKDAAILGPLQIAARDAAEHIVHHTCVQLAAAVAEAVEEGGGPLAVAQCLSPTAIPRKG